jgi:hypothetical protein
VTINQNSVWQQAKVYRNPPVADTPKETRPNNVDGAVNHFSKKVTLRKYTAPKGWQCNGLALSGEHESFDFWCAIKPATSRTKTNRTMLDIGGEYSEGEWLLFYNPYHKNHPKQGIHLQLSDAASDYSGFADVIEYQNKLWIVREFEKLDVDYGDSYRLYIGKATIEEWANPTHNTKQSPLSGGHYKLS